MKQEIKEGEVICYQHQGYITGEYLFSRNAYDYMTREIIAAWRVKKLHKNMIIKQNKTICH